MYLQSYSPKDVVVTIAGIPCIGFSPDSFLTIARNVDQVEESVGADGHLSVTNVADRTGEISILLQQTSVSNQAFASAFQQQQDGIDVVPFTLSIFDPAGSVLAQATNAYFKRTSTMDLGASQNSREWTFGCEALVFG